MAAGLTWINAPSESAIYRVSGTVASPTVKDLIMSNSSETASVEPIKARPSDEQAITELTA